MPSGSKKRKAAKKKKENPNPSPLSTQAHGDGVDVKPQDDDKDSDAGEVSSPASQDRHSSRQNTFSSGEDEERENISNPPLVGKEDIDDDVVDEPRKTEAEEGFVPVERESTIEKESDENDKQLFEHDEIASKSYDGAPSRSSSSLSGSDDESNGIKKSKSENAENAPSDIVSEDTSLSGEKAKMDGSSEDNNSKAPSIEEPEIKNGKLENRSLVEDKVGILDKEVIIIPSVENVGAISDTRECVEQESDDRLSLSYNAPIVSDDLVKDSGISEPLLAHAPHTEGPEQRTSWKSCCGLFEVFTGSAR